MTTTPARTLGRCPVKGCKAAARIATAVKVIQERVYGGTIERHRTAVWLYQPDPPATSSSN